MLHIMRIYVLWCPCMLYNNTKLLDKARNACHVKSIVFCFWFVDERILPSAIIRTASLESVHVNNIDIHMLQYQFAILRMYTICPCVQFLKTQSSSTELWQLAK